LTFVRSNSIELVNIIRIRPNSTIEFDVCNSKFENSSEFDLENGSKYVPLNFKKIYNDSETYDY